MTVSLAAAALITAATLHTPPQANAIGTCASDWNGSAALFKSEIRYENNAHKTNPFVRVSVNGKVVSMMLDTGANINVLWDESLLKAVPGGAPQKFDATASSSDSRKVEATLADGHGNVLNETFYVLPNSVLAADGYSGIVSPQAIAGDNAAIIDFERNCLLTRRPFDIQSDKRFLTHRGTTIPNPYGVMAIPLELDGSKIPVIVDSGASVTTLLSAVVASKPKGKKSPKSMDLLGTEVPRDARMRLVDFKINGQTFRLHPVIPSPTINDNGIIKLGYIGMDILKDRVIYYDGTRYEFTLLTRNRSADASERREE